VIPTKYPVSSILPQSTSGRILWQRMGGPQKHFLKSYNMYQEKVKVLWNDKVENEYYRIGLTCHRGYSGAKPGQFIMLHFPGPIAPFSVSYTHLTLPTSDLV